MKTFITLLAFTLLADFFSVPNTSADCRVRFTGRVDMPELPNERPNCIGNYYVPVLIYEVLEDPCNALSYYSFPTNVAYDEAQNLEYFDMVEVYGFAYTNWTPAACGMIDATQTSSEDYYITVIPAANFSATPTMGLEPLVVNFTDYSTGPVSFWSWDFDNDGTEDSSEQNPSYTYLAGFMDLSYTVSLTVSGSVGGVSYTETKADYISVYGLPVADFGAVPISGPPPLCVYFTPYMSSPGSIDTWSWDFDNDGTEDSTRKNPAYCYESVGKYSVKLTVSGLYGSDTQTKTDFIDVHTAPVIYNLRRKSSEPGNVLKISGISFGDGTDGSLHFANKVLPSDHKAIELWTNDEIRVRIPTAKYLKDGCSWFKGEDSRRLKVWVTVGGVDSNRKKLTLNKPADCQ